MLVVFWLATAALLLTGLCGVALDSPAAANATTIVLILGGLPHGAYDIALLRRASTIGRPMLALVIVAYVAIACGMALLWFTLPLAALILFLVIAAMHFGEDWTMLDEPLFRIAAGAAILAATTIGHPVVVTRLFVAMSDERAALLAQLLVAAAPMLLLTTGVGMVVAWRAGSRNWAAAMAACLILLVALPPVAGFALFFVFLHPPRHLALARATLHTMPLRNWLMTGAALSVTAIVGWRLLWRFAAPGIGTELTAQSFQLLAAVALPHLLLSRRLERRAMDRFQAPPSRLDPLGIQPILPNSRSSA